MTTISHPNEKKSTKVIYSDIIYSNYSRINFMLMIAQFFFRV